MFTVVMLTVAAYCAVRPAAARRWQRTTDLDTDVAHVVMGVAMAGTLTASLVLPAVAWEAVFACGACWFAWRAVQVRRSVAANQWRCPHPVPHLVECAAMLYMLAVAPAAVHATAGAPVMAGAAGAAGAAGGVSMAGSATASPFSVLALAMALFMFGYVAWVGNRLPPPGAAAGGHPPGGRACPSHLAPRCEALCKIAMGITMGYTLILML
jgi:hypothetical protein